MTRCKHAMDRLCHESKLENPGNDSTLKLRTDRMLRVQKGKNDNKGKWVKQILILVDLSAGIRCLCHPTRAVRMENHTAVAAARIAAAGDGLTLHSSNA